MRTQRIPPTRAFLVSGPVTDSRVTVTDMEPPLCRLCRVKHWPREPHIFPDTPRADPKRENTPVQEGPSVPTTEPGVVGTEVSSGAERQRRWREANREKKREADREAKRVKRGAKGV